MIFFVMSHCLDPKVSLAYPFQKLWIRHCMVHTYGEEIDFIAARLVVDLYSKSIKLK